MPGEVPGETAAAFTSDCPPAVCTVPMPDRIPPLIVTLPLAAEEASLLEAAVRAVEEPPPLCVYPEPGEVRLLLLPGPMTTVPVLVKAFVASAFPFFTVSEPEFEAKIARALVAVTLWLAETRHTRHMSSRLCT